MGSPEEPWRPGGSNDAPPGKGIDEASSSGQGNARRPVVDLFGTDMVPAAIVLVLVLLGLMKGARPGPCLLQTTVQRASASYICQHSIERAGTLSCLQRPPSHSWGSILLVELFHEKDAWKLSVPRYLMATCACSCYGATLHMLRDSLKMQYSSRNKSSPPSRL